MFRKPKEYLALSPDEKAWWDSARKLGENEKIAHIVQRDSVALATCLLTYVSKETFFHWARTLALAAASEGAEKVFADLLGRVGRFAGSGFDNKRFHARLSDTAIAHGRLAIWNRLVKKWRGEEADICLPAIFAHRREDILPDFLARKPDLFTKVLVMAVKDSQPENVAGLLASFKNKYSDSDLSEPLNLAVSQGRVDMARVLVAGGARISHVHEEAFTQAIQLENDETLRFLAAEGYLFADKSYHLRQVYHKQLREVPAWVEQHIAQQDADQRARDRVVEENKRYKKVSADSVEEVVSLPQGGSLSLLFNFALRQQIITVRQDAALAVTVKGFSELDDLSALDAVYDAFVAQGGDTAVWQRSHIAKKRPSGLVSVAGAGGA